MLPRSSKESGTLFFKIAVKGANSLDAGANDPCKKSAMQI